MPMFDDGDVHLSYEEHGSGFPILLIAPGGMRSAASYWQNTPWNPIEQLSPTYRVIAMDQRNAGRSTAPVTATDGWDVYTRDQLALLDHLGVDRFHVAGMCIGGSFIMALIAAAPERVASGVVFQTIGLDDNRDAFYEMFDSWADEQKPSQPEVDEAAWERFKTSMYGGDGFLFTASKDDVAQCTTPLLILQGDDLYHPKSSSLGLLAAKDATLVERWKEPADQPAARRAIDDFLAAHTPG